MAVTQEELDSFHEFASQEISRGVAPLTLAELFDIWWVNHPSADELRDNVRAVKASIRDMEKGETGRPFEDFANDFRQRNHIPNDP